ncbi:histidine kinase [Clavibacter sp. MX14-G9D]|uniref:sensor histidine kinase n=1 Tax=Clavibacter sp. MX14-G9D TaxID=3064656 RepID=UPI00293F49D4|nr:histidine kinase [Clavibacter sp. MX14-G9D]
MPRRLRSRLRPYVEPAAGTAFLLLFLLVGLGGGLPEHGYAYAATVAAYAAAIAIARTAPRSALAIVLVVPALQMLGASGVTSLLALVAPPDPTTWPVAAAAPVVAFAIGRTGSAGMQAAALAVGAFQAVCLGFAISASGYGSAGQGLGPAPYGEGVSVGWALLLAGIAAVMYVAAWALGVALRRGGRLLPDRARLVRDRARLVRAEADLEVAGVELRIAQERSGIAQEVHDVLAHSLAVVVAVADGSRFLRETRPETTDEALREIAGTARSALLDLRGLIEELTDDSHRPQPNLADLPALVRGMAATGMRVDLRTTGRPGGLTPSQQLSVYRIVQESLTNALKHTRGIATVDVSFVWEGPGLALTVRSTGSGTPPEPPSKLPPARPRGGFGVGSMQERARLAGGWLTAERTDPEEGETADGYLVTAFLPTYGEHPSDGRRAADGRGAAEGPRADADAGDPAARAGDAAGDEDAAPGSGRADPDGDAS